MKYTRRLVALLAALTWHGAGVGAQGTDSITTDWEVEPGFRVDVVARGFKFPTAIAFVPRPGPAPGDPRFFVTELNGVVKVVTNDGSVLPFASAFASFTPRLDIPTGEGENGTAGICLDPRSGYVFVTFVYDDSARVMRNGMVRFTTQPGTFATKPGAVVSFNAIFAADRSGESHQIGACAVSDGHVFVSVGDGVQHEQSQQLASTLGKVLRMTLEGGAPGDNPHVNDPRGAARFVWASGFRNPFGLRVLGNRVFVAENGLNIDRFLEIERGRNYLWAGNDWSIGLNASVVFAPATSPVQLDYASAAYEPFPAAYRDQFYLALSGDPGTPGAGLPGDRSVVAISYDFARREVRSAPRPIVRYAGNGIGNIVGMSLGPDGLYFAPLFPGADGGSSVLRVSYAPDRPHERLIGSSSNPTGLIHDKGCLGCHRFRGIGGSRGPPLDTPPLRQRLFERLTSAGYLGALSAPDSLGRQPYTSLTDRRQAVVTAAPIDRPKVWLVNWLLEPRFALPAATMPSPGLTESQAADLADLLLGPAPAPPTWRDRIPPSRYRYVLIALVAGLAIGMLLRRGRRPGVR